MPARAKNLNVKNLALPMDARGNPDDLEHKAWRYVQNFRVNARNRVCRLTGWKRLLDKDDYNNHDLHDQLASITGVSDRAPITMLYEGNSTRKTTKLYAGNHHSLYALNPGTGNWRVIAKGYGSGTGSRWRAPAQIADTILFTNNEDQPIYHTFDGGSVDGSAVSTIPDLVTLGITKVGTMIAWKDHIFLMNVVVDGEVRGHGIYWCNYQRPLDWQPAGGSTAGNQDLNYGESILGAAPLGNRLLIYTTKGIWEAVPAGGTGAVFAFVKRYDPRNFGEACLFYPNTLVSIGHEHLYMGVDGIYLYNLFEEKPKRIEYMHRASSVIFDDINRDDCNVHVAGYDFENKEVIFSWARDGEDVPSQSLVFNTEWPFSYVLDHGFTAMVNHVYKGVPYLLRDFLRENCICTDEGLETYWNAFEDEGGFCTEQEPVDCGQRLTEDGEVRLTEDGEIRITEDESSATGSYLQFLWTSNTMTLEEGLETENWDDIFAEDRSLCAHLQNQTISQLCENELRRDECNSGQRFVVASSRDYCLKEFAEVYYREECTGFTGCGTYQRNGYKSLLRSGAMGGDYNADQELSRFIIEATSEVQGTPSKFKLRIGRHSQAIDPNEDNCGIVWEEQPAKEIKCLGGVTAAQHRAMGTVPDNMYEWAMWYLGLYFYFELEVVNDAVTPADTGGSCCISRYSINFRERMRR